MRRKPLRRRRSLAAVSPNTCFGPAGPCSPRRTSSRTSLGPARANASGRYADLYVPPESFIGRRIHEVLRKDGGGPFGRAMRKGLETNGLVTMEYSLEDPSGRKAFEARILPLINDQVVVVVRDITDRKA